MITTRITDATGRVVAERTDFRDDRLRSAERWLADFKPAASRTPRAAARSATTSTEGTS